MTQRLQRALPHARNFMSRRADAVARLPEFDALRDSARDIKDHTLAHLDLYLEAYERKVVEAGGHVHYARDADEAIAVILGLCKARGAKVVTKGKSMISEEIGLNAALGAEGIDGDRDRPRRIHHPAARRGAFAHHRPGDPRHPRRHRGRLPPRPSRPRARPRPVAARAIAQRGARDPARQLPVRRHRRDRRQFPDRRDRDVDHRHQRRQRRSDPDPAQGPRRHRLARKDHADAERRGANAARARPFGDRPGHVGLHDAVDRPAPTGRSRRAGRISRRAARQRPLGDARRTVRGHAALHPLRRLHEPLSGLSRDRRPRLRLGLSRTDGRGADAAADRRRRRRAIAERLDLLRPLRGGLSDAHSAAEHDAALARARVRTASVAAAGARRAAVVGVLRQAAAALSLRCRAGDARARPDRPRAAAASPGCRSPAAGRADAISPRRRARRSRAAGGRRAGRPNERARRDLRLDPPLARTSVRSTRRVATRSPRALPRRRSGSFRVAARARRPNASRPSRPRRSASRRRSPRSRSSADVPAEIARFLRENNLPATLRFGDDTRLADMPWAATALEIARGPSDGDDLNAVSAAFAAVAETGTLALGLRRRQSDDAQLPARQSYRRRLRRRRRRRLRKRVRPAARGTMGRARCRARSISSPARRARPTSSRPCCSAPMGRGGCISLLSPASAAAANWPSSRFD